jgi:hypothetical protein
MQIFFYTGAATAALVVILTILLDIWIYKSTNSIEIVLNEWMNRYSKNTKKLSPKQLALQRVIVLLERVLLIFAILLMLSKLA